MSVFPKDSKALHSSRLGSVPLVYDPGFQFDLMGLEKFHPFSNKRYSRVIDYLVSKGLIPSESWFLPLPLSAEALSSVHTPEYLTSLNDPDSVFSDFESFSLARQPKFSKVFRENKAELARRIVQTEVLGAGGTLLASQLVLGTTWRAAINLSGGYHHAYSDKGSGFCLIADAPIVISKILSENPKWKILVVDLDAHHGDGNADYFAADRRVKIFDIYNRDNFPMPGLVASGDKHSVEFEYPISKGTGDDAYLGILANELPKAVARFRPNLIFYNAGTDIFEKDPLGGLKITANGIIRRDQIVFETALTARVPLFMALSGGYSEDVFDVIGQSIENLMKKGLFGS